MSGLVDQESLKVNLRKHLVQAKHRDQVGLVVIVHHDAIELTLTQAAVDYVGLATRPILLDVVVVTRALDVPTVDVDARTTERLEEQLLVGLVAAGGEEDGEILAAVLVVLHELADPVDHPLYRTARPEEHGAVGVLGPVVLLALLQLVGLELSRRQAFDLHVVLIQDANLSVRVEEGIIDVYDVERWHQQS